MKRPAWIRALFPRPVAPVVLRPRAVTRLGVEQLEDREVPATFMVMSAADSGAGSLRQAIADAKAMSDGADIITFDTAGAFATAQTITLSSGQLDLTNITGTLAIQGTGANLLSISGNSTSRVFFLAGSSSTLTDLTVTGGSGVGVGSSGYGGGIFTQSGTLTLTNCTVTGNSAVSGGGIYNRGGTTTLTDCTVSGNTATDGGGILSNGGTLGLINCTVTGNSATNNGGGIDTIAGTTTLTNCTVTGNSATNDGGGMRSSTSSNTVTLTNSIVVGNTASLNGGISGPVDGSSSNNVIGTGGSGGLTGGTNGNQVGVSPAALKLAPLGDYGGPTKTFALLPGSVAIGHGITVAGATTDQRGVLRAAVGMPTDVGAFQTATVPLMVSVTGDAGASAVAGVLTKLTLREAINLAAVTDGNDTVTFDPTVFATAKTITLTQSLLDLTNATGVTGTLTIQGTGANLLSISGNGGSRVFFQDSGSNSTLKDLTITGGSATGSGPDGYGGAVYTRNSTLVLTDCVVTGNSATYGGGIYTTGGTATLTNCTVSGNSATSYGGGVYHRLGALALTDCLVTGNTATAGGGVFNRSGTATLTDCTVTSNSATGSGAGGGVLNFGGTTTLTGCTVSGNFATSGGGVFNYASGALGLIDCTVSGNSADYGGGVANNGGTTTLTNVTVAGNTAIYGGGAANMSGTLALINCTVSGNSADYGGGVYVDSGTVGLTNSIVAGNTTSDDPGTDVDLVNGTASGSNNLIGNNPTFTTGSNNTPNVTAAQLALAPLGNYGGPTQTMALLPGSIAINAGATTGAPATDQRGKARFGATDIGAVESQGYTLTPTSNGTPQTAPAGAAFANPLSVTVAPDDSDDPVNGGVVAFAAPVSGASATLSTATATITGGTATVTATANGTGGAFSVTASAVGAPSAAFALTNELQPALTGLSSLTVAAGTGSVTLTGSLSAGATAATGSVTVTISGNGIAPLSQSVALSANGSFSATFNTAALGGSISAYTVAYTYAAQNGFSAANGTTMLTVTLAPTPPGMPPSVPPTASPVNRTVVSIPGGGLSVSQNGQVVLTTGAPFAGFAGGVTTALGDVNGDGIADVVAGASAGADHVKVFDGKTGAELRSFLAFGGYAGGVFVGAGDVNGDGIDDIIIGAASGAPGGHVKVFDGKTGAELRSFFAFAGYTGGVSVSSADMNGDGTDDLVVGTVMGADHVKVFDGKTGAELRSFFAFGGFTSGVFVGTGDVNGDGTPDVIVGAGAGAPAGHVKVFDGKTGAEIRSFFAFAGFRGGTRVAGADTDGDGIAEIIVGTGPGANHVKVFGLNLDLLSSQLVAGDPIGVFVS